MNTLLQQQVEQYPGDHIPENKDNGVGINKINQSKVFDIFYRVSGNSIGSGLGLYIVKETVTKLHGTINLISSPDEGSEFIIYIPNS